MNNSRKITKLIHSSGEIALICVGLTKNRNCASRWAHTATAGITCGSSRPRSQPAMGRVNSKSPAYSAGSVMRTPGVSPASIMLLTATMATRPGMAAARRHLPGSSMQTQERSRYAAGAISHGSSSARDQKWHIIRGMGRKPQPIISGSWQRKKRLRIRRPPPYPACAHARCCRACAALQCVPRSRDRCRR